MQSRDSATSDPVFLTIDNVSIPFLVCARGHFTRGTSSIGFRDTDSRLIARQYALSGNFFLFFGAIGHDGTNCAHVRLNGDAPHGRTGFGHLFDHECRFKVAKSATAVRLWHSHSHESCCIQFSNVVPRVSLCGIGLGCGRFENCLC